MNEQDKNTQNTSTANTENKFNPQNQNAEPKKNFPTSENKPLNINTADNKNPSVDTDSIKDTAKGVYDQAKDTAGQAYGVATKRATEVIEEKKVNFAGGLTSVADSIKQVGESLRDTDSQNQITETAAKYGDTLAQQIEKVSAYFEKKDVREMVGDAERFARRNPAVFIGAAFGLGILAARFLKSSPTGNAKKQSFNSGNRNTLKSLNETAANPS